MGKKIIAGIYSNLHFEWREMILFIICLFLLMPREAPRPLLQDLGPIAVAGEVQEYDYSEWLKHLLARAVFYDYDGEIFTTKDGLWLVDPYSNEITEIVNPADKNSYYIDYFEWSPDGSKLAYILDSRLYIYDPVESRSLSIIDEVTLSACWKDNSHLLVAERHEAIPDSNGQDNKDSGLRFGRLGNSNSERLMNKKFSGELSLVSIDGSKTSLFVSSDNSIYNVSYSSNLNLILLTLFKHDDYADSRPYIAKGILKEEEFLIDKLEYNDPLFKLDAQQFMLNHQGSFFAYVVNDYSWLDIGNESNEKMYFETRIAEFAGEVLSNVNVKRFIFYFPMAWNKTGDALVLFGISDIRASVDNAPREAIIYDLTANKSYPIEIKLSNEYMYRSFSWSRKDDLLAFAESPYGTIRGKPNKISIFDKEGKLIKQLDTKGIYVRHLAW